MVASPVKPLSDRDAVAPQLHRKLRERIVACELTPGQRISETEVATTYGVSRQPVREAFIKLAEESLVVVRPQRGTFIRRISVPAALTGRFIREAVEVELVREAVDRVTPELLSEFDGLLDQQADASQHEDPAEFMRLDEDFHKLLAQCAGVPTVSDYLDGLNVPMNRVRNISAREFAPGKLVVQHRAIVEALRARDAEAAESAMREHLHEFNKDLPRIIETYPDYFEGTEALA